MAKPLRAKFFIQPQLKGNLPNAGYIQLIVIISFFLFSNNLTGQTTIESNSDGSWNSTNIWDRGIIPYSPNYAIINNTDTIKAGTTIEIDSLTISTTGKLVVEGTLIVNGGLNMEDNGSELITDSLANVFIFGNASLANKVSINLASYFVVLGDFKKSGSHNQGELVINNAHIYILGTVDIPDKPDTWQNFTICTPGEYEGTTATEEDECDAGQLDDFIDNVDPEELPDGIYEEIVGCEEPTIINNPSTSSAQYCVGETAATVTISATGDALTYQWHRDDDTTPEEGDEIPVGANSNTYIASTSSPGTFYYYCVVTGDCGTATSNLSGAVTVYGTTITSGTVGGATELILCEGGNPGTLSVGSPTGGDGNYTYQWEESDGCSGTWTDAMAQDGNTNTLSFDPPVLNSTICYRLKITDGCGSLGYSDTKTYNVVHAIETTSHTASDDTTICNGGTASLNVELQNPDKSIYFNGSSGRVDIPNSSEINTYSGSSLTERTVAMWFNANEVITRQVIYEEGGGVNGFSIYLETGYLYVHAWESNNSWGQVRTPVNEDTWYHVTFVYDANAIDGEYFKGFLNGKYFDGTSNINGNDGLKAHSGDINIGHSSNIRYPDISTSSNDYFNGFVDDFKLWNRSLAPHEIFSEQFNVNDGSASGANLIVYYNFNDDTGSTITDETGGNNGTSTTGSSYEIISPFTPLISWTPGGMTDFTVDVNPSGSTNYTYTLTHPVVGCETGDSIQVTVQSPPTATITGDALVCEGNTDAFLEYSDVSGNPDKFSIDFNSTAENQGFVDTGGSLTGGEIEITVPGSAQPDTYSAELTVTNSTTDCTSEVYNITIIIHPLPATGEIIPD